MTKEYDPVAEATNLLTSQFFKDVVVARGNEIKDEWESCPDAITRERLWQEIQALKDVVAKLRTIVENPKFDQLRKRRVEAKDGN